MRTGHLRFYDRLVGEIPPSLIALTEIPHVGPKTAMVLYQKLGIQGMADLEKAIEDGRLKGIPGMGPKMVETIEQGLRLIQKRSAEHRDLLGIALPVVRRIIQQLRQSCPEIDKIEVAGSTRRWRPTVGDIDLLATSQNPARVIDCFASLPLVDHVDSRGANKATVRLNNGLQVDFYVLDPAHYISLLNHFTGSKEHNIRLRDLALNKGYHLNEYGLFKNEKRMPTETEEEIYNTLGLDWIPPELREDRGEIDAAAKHRLPNLVTLEDIKGDLHCHTTWSDGQESVLEMARYAKKCGYQYMAITDHSQSLSITNGLTIDRLHAQRKEIEEAQRAIGDDFRIFHGTELEIKPDGSLDFPDEVLAWLDIVVASIHSGLRQPGEQVTERAIRAVNNPNVDILGHPTGRIINQREPSDMDVPAVMKEAAKSGCAMEINSAPDRLDLDDSYVKVGMDSGCIFSVDTDAHHHDNYELMEYGVHVARRGWATADRIITTWPLDKLEHWLKNRGK
jgi:DNA polymerase (family 10)